MARREEANEHGVPGRRWTVAEEGKPAAIGWGQHGGWGPDETRPFLMLNAPGIAPGVLRAVDLAGRYRADASRFPGAPADGMDGRSLL